MTKIGITERGDAALDLSWINKLDTVDGAIVISKNVCSEKFRKALLEHKDKLIFHATITFLGGSAFEPNVPKPSESLEALQQLISDGFPAHRVVFRLDPILNLPYQIDAFNNAERYLAEMGIERVRFSFIDFYPHVKRRFASKGLELPPLSLNGFTLSESVIRDAISALVITPQRKHNFCFEACAENIGQDVPGLLENIGCISQKDLNLFGIYGKTFFSGYQRRGCKCLSVKTELLSNKAQCPHGCLYCYWKG